MTERYLFRGKRLDNGEWVIGSYVPEYFFDYNFFWCRKYDGYIHSGWSKADDATVGQCTGLRDKNGTLIFEGDIVTFTEHFNEHRRFVVQFSDESLRYGLYIPGFGMHEDFYEIAGDDLEIIGNIHDDPGLLS